MQLETTKRENALLSLLRELNIKPSRKEKTFNNKVYSGKTLQKLILTLENKNDSDSLVINTNTKQRSKAYVIRGESVKKLKHNGTKIQYMVDKRLRKSLQKK